jgi:hypothetical protein
MKKLLLAVCLFSLSVPLLAQQGQTGVNGFSFIAPMQISAGTDNNFLVDRTNPNERLFVLSLSPSIQPGAPDIRPKQLDDQLLMLTMPKIAYQNDSKRHEFTATWVPEFELFRHNTDQNSMNQQAVAGFTYFLARNMSFSVGDTYKTSKDPARALSNVFLLLPRSRYRENDVRGRFEFQPNAVTSVGLRYDYSHTNFGQTDPFQARILDSISNSYSLVVTRMLHPNHRVRGTYTVFKVTPINRARKNDDAVDTHRAFENPIHSGVLEYRVGLNPSTILEVSGGLIKLDTGFNYTFRGNRDKRLGDFWISGGYARTLSFQAGSSTGFAPGLGSNGFFDVFLMRFKGQPTRKTAVLFDTTVSRDASSRLVGSSRALLGRARFDYRLSDRNVLFTSLESLQQNSNAYVRSPLSRNRFMVGIEISLSSETERRMNRSNEDAQYVALTDHQRRRTIPD